MAGVFKSETAEVKTTKCTASRALKISYTGTEEATEPLHRSLRKKNRSAINNLCDFYCYVPNVFVVLLWLSFPVLYHSILLLAALCLRRGNVYLPYSGALWLIANQRQFKGNKKKCIRKTFQPPSYSRVELRPISLLVASSNNAEDKLTLDNFSLDSSLPSRARVESGEPRMMKTYDVLNTWHAIS